MVKSNLLESLAMPQFPTLISPYSLMFCGWMTMFGQELLEDIYGGLLGFCQENPCIS
jgi:hypothetical protein